MRAKIGQLWLQTHIAVSFWYTILCLLTRISRQLGRIWTFYIYGTTSLLWEMSIFGVRAVYEIRLASYGSNHALLFLSDVIFVRTSTHNYMCNWELQVEYARSAYIERLLYYRRYSLCGYKLHQTSEWRTTPPDTHRGPPLVKHCRAYTASPHIHRYLVRAQLLNKRHLYCQRCIVL